MADQTAAIEIAHPPEVVLRVVNPVLRRVLQTPLGGRLSEFMLVNFTGRKSGRRFSVPVSAHHLNDDLHVLLEAQWKYNFRDGADAEVFHLGKKSLMRGELITDPSVVVDIVHHVAQSSGAKRAQRSLGMKFRDHRVPTMAEWEEAVPRLKIAAIKLTPKA